MNDLFSQDLTIPYNRNRGNQKILDQNRKHFSGQAKIVYDAMMNGVIVSSEWGINCIPKIFDIRARIFTLRKKEVQFSEGKIVNGNGAKCWYMSPSQIAFNSLK